MTVTDPRRRVPATGEVLTDPRLAYAVERLGRPLVKSLVTRCLARVRAAELAAGDVVTAVLAELPETAASVRRVLNATGVVVHTNLGRAPLSDAAVAAAVTAAGATDVEFDLATGRRGRRGRGALAALADQLRREPAPAPGMPGRDVPGPAGSRPAVPRPAPPGPAVHVVNNNAAGLMLVAAGLAAGREIVISRGELVEIGDGFRIPDLLVASGARLHEVGTTNRTSLDDYRAAVGPDTALVLKVHPSNFVVRGFTAQVPVTALASLGTPVVVDTGSGLLHPDPLLPDEPDVASALADGADLVLASGDKLLGGPQCGLMVGSPELVERLRRHPLARAVRVDKVTLAALEASLRGPGTPVRRMLDADLDQLRERAAAVAGALSDAGLAAGVVPSRATVGGGAAPGVTLPSYAAALPQELAARLRRGVPAVVGRLEGGRLLLDLRSVLPEHDAALVAAVSAVAPSGPVPGR